MRGPLRRIVVVAWVAAVMPLAGCGHGTEREAADAPAPPSREAMRPSPVDADATPALHAFDWQSRVGLATRAGKGLAFAVPDTALAAGALVTMIWLDEPQRVTRARVLGRGDKPWTIAGSAVEGRTYELTPDSAAAHPHGYAIAVTGDVGEATIENGRARLDLDGDGQPETFRQCSSAEGLHLTVWSGEPLSGPQDWHRYVYLGMDLEVTCTETESGP